ncbi:amine GPCR [Clonorchis sinensis]|uniref:Amine GPCR n=1 Tax=Clonorchis sinensis TaxID=79923 RepID=G7Y662_CLOSI|nr:amine GPCR [Clonorchis sinensis]
MNGSNTTTSISYPEALESMPLWMKVVVILIQVVGISANAIVFAGIAHIKLGSLLTTKLLLSQSVFDGLISLVALLKAVGPPFWYTGNSMLDTMLCHLWFSYFTFWLFVLLSMCNLVCTAFDRLNAVVYNKTYQKRQKIYLALCYSCIVVYSITLASINPLLLEFHNNECIPSHSKRGNWIDTLIKIDSVCWPLFSYTIPCAAVILMYSKIITELRKPSSASRASPANQSMDRIQNIRKRPRHRRIAHSLTIATCIMQTLFLLTHAHDRIYYFLGINHWIEYRVGSLPHLLGLWLITLNSCLNPAALVFTMKTLQQWILCRVRTTTVTTAESDNLQSDRVFLDLLRSRSAKLSLNDAVTPSTNL